MEYKLAVLGGAAVGKSSIVVRYIRDSFTDTVCDKLANDDVYCSFSLFSMILL